MILRRVIAHFRKQEWTAITIDFVIVVMGVFVGIQVSTWNAARVDRAAETGYLASLEEDVEMSIDSLEKQIGMMEKQQAARSALLSYSRDPQASLDPADRDRLVAHGLFYLPSLNLSGVTFETLKSSGRLSVIKSPALVSELQALSADIEGALSRERDEIEVTYLFSDPLLVSDFDMLGLFSQLNLSDAPPLKGLPEMAATSPSPSVMKSTRFGNVLLYRSFFTSERLVFLQRVLERHKKIAGLIDARQANLGAAE
jgi:hypothetical protein